MPSKLYVFLSHLLSRAGCGIGLYRFLSVAVSSSVIVFILGLSQNMTSVLAICIFQHLPRGLANVNAKTSIFDSYIK